MFRPWRIGALHAHAFDNIPALATDDAAPGDVLTVTTPGGTPVWEPPGSGVPDGGTTGQALVKDSGADGDASWHDIEDLATAEMDDSLVLKPDGAGGVAFSTAAVSGITAVRTYVSFGCDLGGETVTP